MQRAFRVLILKELQRSLGKSQAESVRLQGGENADFRQKNADFPPFRLDPALQMHTANPGVVVEKK